MCDFPIKREEKVGEMLLYVLLHLTPNELDELVGLLNQVVETRNKT